MSSSEILDEGELIRLDDPQDDVAIKFDHVTKRYRLYADEQERLASIFWPRKKRKGITTINANDDLSFEVKRGEGVAFLGSNGAGKSTALKMITGVTYPTKGDVIVNGRVSALLELRAGFDPKMSGRENIYLRGQALGFSMEELQAMEKDVVDFADIGVYIDQPVCLYSSGMKARLGFGFAVASKPEILMVDEALSVGDRTFRKKCLARVHEIMEDEDVTFLFVTHSSKSAKEFCKRGIVLDHGKMKFDGPIQDAGDGAAPSQLPGDSHSSSVPRR